MVFDSVYGVSSITSLKAEYPSSTSLAIVLGSNYPIVEAEAIYAWDAGSMAVPDDNQYILSNFSSFATVGRWNKVDSAALPQINSDWTATTGAGFILNKPTISTVGNTGNYSDLVGKPTLSTVAGTGVYADLISKPTIPDAQVNSDWSAVSGVSQISNKPSLSAVATTGSYLDLSNKPTRTQSSATRSLNSAFQISSTRDVMAIYTVQLTVTASITGGQNGDIVLEIASNSGFTTDVQTIGVAGFGQTYTLALTLQGTQPDKRQVMGMIPAGYYARLRTVNNTGTPSYSYVAGQETLL